MTTTQAPFATRRPLSSQLPPTRSGGDTAIARVLFHALDAAAHDDADTLTHGFHSWPARMHPSIAGVLLDELVPRRDAALVVDCFCGSGTTLIEARRRGLASLGVDLNPLALRVAEVKTDVGSDDTRARLRAVLTGVVERSKDRVRERAPVVAHLPRPEIARYGPHVLKELAGLLEEIRSVDIEHDRRTLEVVFSSIVIKCSNQRADSDDRESQRRIGRFVPTELFERKAHELLERQAEFAHVVPKGTRAPELVLHDARALPAVLGREQASLVVTSPPYGGTYDYADHHARRIAWLGLKARRLELGEIGARRRATLQRWDEEMGELLRAVRDGMRPDGLAVILLGDAHLEGRRVVVDEQLQRLAPAAGLRVVAHAAAPRPDWRGGPAREEHLVALAPLPRSR